MKFLLFSFVHSEMCAIRLNTVRVDGCISKSILDPDFLETIIVSLQ